MTAKKNRDGFITALIFLCGLCWSQTRLSYDYTSFLNAVKRTNPLAIRAENSGIYGKVQLKAARGNFDPQLASSLESKQFNSNNYFTYGNAELKQQLYTSQYVKVGYQYGQGLYLDPERSTPVSGLPYLGLEASVLQGLMFDKRRADVMKAKHYADFFNAEQNVQYNELMFAAANLYIDALFTKKIMHLYSYFAHLADQRLRGISQLAVVGERPSVDTIEAAIFLQGRLLDKQSGEIELIKKLNELSILNPPSAAVAVSEINISDSLDLVYSKAVATIQQTIANELSTNPVIASYMAKQRVLETEKRLKRELIKPKLDLQYNFLGNSNGASYLAFNTNNYKYGAFFSFPLFFRKPLNEYKMAVLEAQNNELETANKRNQVHFKRKYILEAIKVTLGQIANAERASAHSKLLVEAERLKFTNGESSLFLLNSREGKWLETELKLAEYKLKFVRHFVELTYVNGDLKYEL